MKKRAIKKLRNKEKIFSIEGNKGGDFVEIQTIKDDRIYIKSGCSCVMSIDSVVPNEFLSILISDCMLKYGSVENFIEQSNYDKEYKDELIAKIGVI